MLLQAKGQLQKQIERSMRNTSSYCVNRSRVARLRPASLGRQQNCLERSKNRHGMHQVRCPTVPHRKGEKGWPLITHVETVHLRQCSLFFTVSDCPLWDIWCQTWLWSHLSLTETKRELLLFYIYRSLHFNFLLLIKKHKAACLCKVTKAKFTKEKKINITGFNKE